MMLIFPLGLVDVQGTALKSDSALKINGAILFQWSLEWYHNLFDQCSILRHAFHAAYVHVFADM